MPRRNTRPKEYSRTFHVYNRARNRGNAFVDDNDRDYFCDLLHRRLLSDRFLNRVTLLSACPLTTHYHQILRELQPGAMTELMHAVLGPYVRRFNARHGRRGPLFAGEFRRKPITSQRQLRWTIAYVHDNHPSGLAYRYSTHRYFLEEAGRAPQWLDVDSGLAPFGGIEGYLRDLESRRDVI